MFAEFLLSQNITVKNDTIFQEEIGEGVGHCPESGLILINEELIKSEGIEKEFVLVHEYIHHLQHKISDGKRLPKEIFAALCGEYQFKNEIAEKEKQAALKLARYYPPEEFGIELEAYFLEFIVKNHLGVKKFIDKCEQLFS